MNHDRSDLLELRDKMRALLNSNSCWRITLAWNDGRRHTKVTPISVLSFILYPSATMNYAKITYRGNGAILQEITSNTHVPLFFTTREEAVEAIMMDKLTGTKRYPPVRGPNL